MSIYGSLMGDFEEDPYFTSSMTSMRRHMGNMMNSINSLFMDPFAMMHNDFSNRMIGHRMPNSMPNAMMPFGFPMNRLLSASLDSIGDNPGMSSHFSSSSTVISMSSGPDGRPQVYKATSSTRVAPGGIKETQRTECDSRTGTKKMAIGHHIGERAHIVEREQNIHSGDREERQDFINIEEDDAEDFNKEWETRTRSHNDIPRIAGPYRNRYSYGGHSGVPAITSGPSSRRHRDRHSSSSLVSPRRTIRSSPLALPSSSSSRSSISPRTPYSPPCTQTSRRPSKNIKTVSGSPPSPNTDN